MIGQTISHYKILEKLGAGGMGVVYKAQDTKLNRAVALKFLPLDLTHDAETIDRFVNEAQAASALDHTNICTIYEIGETEEGQMFIVMAYYDGETLQQKVASGQLSVDSVIDIVTQTARGLERAHDAGITHRDIKPSNLIITPRGEVKIIDFGLAKLTGQTRLTKTGTTLGTVAYMSPEQVQAQPVDHRTDIWSLGVVLYEILTGKLPFRGDYETAMIYAIINEKPDSALKYRLELSQEFLHLLDRALAKSLTDRYQSMSDMLVDLRRLKTESTKDTAIGLPCPASGGRKISEVPVASQAPRPSRKKIWLSLGVVAVLAIIATILLWPPERRLKLNPNMTFRTLPIPFTQIGKPELSMDSKWMAFPAADGYGNWDIYFMNVSGGEPQQITATIGAYSSLDISPDGSLVAYDSWDEQLQRPEVGVISSMGRTSKVLVRLGSAPRWRSDGKRIGYTVSKIFSKSGGLEFWSVQPNSIDNRLEFVDSAITIDAPFVSWSWSPGGKCISWIRTFSTGHREVIVRE